MMPADVTNRLPNLQLAVDGAHPAASAAETAAAIAAVQRFLRDHARPATQIAGEAISGWVQAAREEAVDTAPEGSIFPLM